MSKGWNRAETWLALIVVVVGALLAAIFGLHAYMTATAAPLHPDARQVPSSAGVVPPAGWVSAVGRSRTAIRERVTAQNLPGVSVAVGLGDAIVWTEGSAGRTSRPACRSRRRHDSGSGRPRRR